jgi:uncharacterized protein YebE (UPF0316 family)
MDLQALFAAHSDWWWLLPVLVFVARVLDVSLGTLRVLFVSRGVKALAPIVGFFEVLIWIAAIAQVVRNLDNGLAYLAYAAGYGVGTFVGLCLEERLAFGSVVVRVITQRDSTALVADLRRRNYGVTCVDATGVTGQVKIIFTVVRRRHLHDVLAAVLHFNPHAFYTIEDVRAISRAAW